MNQLYHRDLNDAGHVTMLLVPGCVVCRVTRVDIQQNTSSQLDGDLETRQSSGDDGSSVRSKPDSDR
jgi:hypothetical protein